MDKEAIKKDIDKLVSLNDGHQFDSKLHSILCALLDAIEEVDEDTGRELYCHEDRMHDV